MSIPAENPARVARMRDPEVRREVVFHPVRTMDEVLALALRGDRRPVREERTSADLGGDALGGAVMH